MWCEKRAPPAHPYRNICHNPYPLLIVVGWHSRPTISLNYPLCFVLHLTLTFDVVKCGWPLCRLTKAVPGRCHGPHTDFRMFQLIKDVFNPFLFAIKYSWMEMFLVLAVYNDGKCKMIKHQVGLNAKMVNASNASVWMRASTVQRELFKKNTHNPFISLLWMSSG